MVYIAQLEFITAIEVKTVSKSFNLRIYILNLSLSLQIEKVANVAD